MKKILISLLCMLTVLLTGCSDYDNGYSEKSIKYDETFRDAFGYISSNQDWNGATRLTASVSLDPSINGTLKIYTTAPSVAGSELLATTDVTDGQGEITFDAPKGSQMFYACVRNHNKLVSSGYYAVKDKAVSISTAGSLATRAATTCNVTKEAYSFQALRMPQAAVAELANSGGRSYSAFKTGGYDKYHWYDRTATTMPNLYKLNGVDFSTHDAGYSVGELKPIFNSYVNSAGQTKDGVFKEQVDHIAQYVKTGILTTDATLTVEEDGEVTLDCMWRGTEYDDFFGYYYYPEGTTLTAEQLWNINKYILIDEESGWIQKESSLTQIADYKPTYTYDAASGQNVIAADGWGEFTNMSGMNAPAFISSRDDKAIMRGTVLKLTYFGADGNGTPTYQFPKGTKIGFFIAHKSVNKVFYSDCKLTYQLYYPIYTSPANSAQEDNDQARPYAVKFVYNGRTFMGFGDEMGDCDNNDLVFAATNVVPPTDEDITPSDLPMPSDASWIIACEDLGGSFDYDFNDVVLRISHVAGTNKASITPLAAGGTLPVYLYHQNGGARITEKELHQLWGADRPYNVQINDKKAGTPGETVWFTVDEDYTVTYVKDGSNMGGIELHVLQNGTSEATSTVTLVQAPSKGTAPQMLLIPYSYWSWPQEGVNINKAYPSFASFVSTGTPLNWYDAVASNQTVNIGGGTSNGGNTGNTDNTSSADDNNNENQGNTGNQGNDDSQNDNENTDNEDSPTVDYGQACAFTADESSENFYITSDDLNSTGITSGAVTLTFVGTFTSVWNDGNIWLGGNPPNSWSNWEAYASAWGNWDGCSCICDHTAGTVTVTLSAAAYADAIARSRIKLETSGFFIPSKLYIK